MAVGFTALANTLLLATCVYREWIPPRQLLGGAIILAFVWLLSWWRSRFELRRSGNQQLASDASEEESTAGVAVALSREKSEQLIRDAQQVYLAGDWVATEQLLLKLLKEDARDVQGRLMLATLWRRQGRHGEALRQLDKLARLEAADEWQYEIAAERLEIAERQEFIEQQETASATTIPIDQKPNEETNNEHSADVPADQQVMNNETNRRLAA